MPAGNFLVHSTFMPGEFNNYLLGGNVCNAFAVGDVGSEDDFFLIGAEPEEESSFPMLTGNILDSEGDVLFRLVRNTLVINPGNCSKIYGDHIGYEIHDATGELIFRVNTQFRTLPEWEEPCFVTTLTANFFDKDGTRVLQANSGEGGEWLHTSVPGVLGYAGGSFGFVQDLDELELDLIRYAIESHGAIHRLVTGRHEDETLSFDGALVRDAEVLGCTVAISTGNFAFAGEDIRIEDCGFRFSGAAAQITDLVLRLDRQELD